MTKKKYSFKKGILKAIRVILTFGLPYAALKYGQLEFVGQFADVLMVGGTIEFIRNFWKINK